MRTKLGCITIIILGKRYEKCLIDRAGIRI